MDALHVLVCVRVVRECERACARMCVCGGGMYECACVHVCVCESMCVHARGCKCVCVCGGGARAHEYLCVLCVCVCGMQVNKDIKTACTVQQLEVSRSIWSQVSVVQ